MTLDCDGITETAVKGHFFLPLFPGTTYWGAREMRDGTETEEIKNSGLCSKHRPLLFFAPHGVHQPGQGLCLP